MRQAWCPRWRAIHSAEVVGWDSSAQGSLCPHKKNPTVDLAKRSGVSLSAVQDFERGQETPIANNIAAIRRAIEAAGDSAGIRENGVAAGILRQDADPDPIEAPDDMSDGTMVCSVDLAQILGIEPRGECRRAD